MDSNSTCHKLDPSLILEMASIVQRNKEAMESLLQSLSQLSSPDDLVQQLIIVSVAKICQSIYNTNSVLDAMIDTMIDDQLEEPTSNM